MFPLYIIILAPLAFTWFLWACWAVADMVMDHRLYKRRRGRAKFEEYVIGVNKFLVPHDQWKKNLEAALDKMTSEHDDLEYPGDYVYLEPLRDPNESILVQYMRENQRMIAEVEETTRKRQAELMSLKKQTWVVPEPDTTAARPYTPEVTVETIEVTGDDGSVMLYPAGYTVKPRSDRTVDELLGIPPTLMIDHLWNTLDT